MLTIKTQKAVNFSNCNFTCGKWETENLKAIKPIAQALLNLTEILKDFGIGISVQENKEEKD